MQQENNPEQAEKDIRENEEDNVRNVIIKRYNVYVSNGAEPLSRGPWNTGARSVRICRESLLT